MERRDWDQDWMTTSLTANLSADEMKWRNMLRYWMFEYSQVEKQFQAANERAERAEADNAALREALHAIVYHQDHIVVMPEKMWNLAKEALDSPHPGAELLQRVKVLEAEVERLREIFMDQALWQQNWREGKE